MQNYWVLKINNTNILKQILSEVNIISLEILSKFISSFKDTKMGYV